GGAIAESGTRLILTRTSSVLTTSSATGTTLTNANQVGRFNATNTTSGNVALTNTAMPLTITGISEAGGGNIAVTNTGAISATGTISASGAGTVALTTSGAGT